MPGPPLVFPFASELDGKVQFGPDVLCEFAGFEAGSIVLTSVKNDIGFGHKVIEGHQNVPIPKYNLRQLSCQIEGGLVHQVLTLPAEDRPTGSRLVTALAALLTLVTSGDHRNPRIRSWDGTTLRLEWGGLIFCFAHSLNSQGGAQQPKT